MDRCKRPKGAHMVVDHAAIEFVRSGLPNMSAISTVHIAYTITRWELYKELCQQENKSAISWESNVPKDSKRWWLP